MEMNFPHRAKRTIPDTSTESGESVVDAARTRQAKSRTVRAMRLAEHGKIIHGNDLAARIHCFAAEPSPDVEARGSFWQKTETAKINKEPVYQSASANSKDQMLSPSGTGTQLNLDGHGAEKNHD